MSRPPAAHPRRLTVAGGSRGRSLRTATGGGPQPPDGSAPGRAGERRFLTVRQLADYLQINEKKVYALASEGRIPGTKITGKWLFPRVLVDQWLMEASHGGVLTDRLILTGSDDPLLSRVVMNLSNDVQSRALLTYTCTGTTLGLSLLATRRADACGIHWGPAEESDRRHPALLAQFPQHNQWVLVRAFRREQGLLAGPGVVQGEADVRALFGRDLRWVFRQEGAGSQRYLTETAAVHDVRLADLDVVGRALSEREAASRIALAAADIAPGVRGAAREFGLDFVSIGWEAFDFAVYRTTFFRALFQKLLEELRSPRTRELAAELGGYSFNELGRLIWS